jgi:hypothetical protein
MQYEIIKSIGNCIDNVYNNYSENEARRTVARLEGENMSLTFMTIINVSKDYDLHYQMKNLVKEANDMIKSRLNLIKSEFKTTSGRALSLKKIKTHDNVETLTVSPYSPLRKLKYSYTITYEVS